jgi:hypothetical protein
MSGITGDFAALDGLIRQYGDAANAVTRALVVAAPKIQAQARANYASNKGPDGAAWPRNKDGTAPSLARPAAAVTFTASGDSIVGEAEEVLAYHQEGNDRLPRRPVFPDGAIPLAWQALIADALRAQLGDTQP